MSDLKYLLKKWLGRILYTPFCLLPLEDKVVFSNFSGKRYADNPKYISERLRKDHPEIRQIWLHHKNAPRFIVPDSIEVVDFPSFKMMYHLATAKVWVDSHYKQLYTIKRKGQFFIETWHGGLGFKKIEGDAADKLTKEDLEKITHNCEMADVFISNSKWLSEIYRRAFHYKGEILECGYPKERIFLEDLDLDIKKRVYSYYKLSDETRIVLYAPTFRNGSDLSYLDLDYNQVIHALEKKTGDKWVLFIRLHPLMMNLSAGMNIFSDKVIDATDYPDMQELSLASDLFVTDYSSGIFDFVLSRKPAFLYASDVKEYIKERGLYFDLHDMPFPFAENNEMMIHNIISFDNNKYLHDLDDFYQYVGYVPNKKADVMISDLIYQKLRK